MIGTTFSTWHCRTLPWLRLSTSGLLIFLLTGCMSPFGGGTPAETPKPVDSMVIGTSGAQPMDPGLENKPGPDTKAYAELAQAMELFKAKDLNGAEKIFNKLAKHKKNPLTLMEEARYYEAECQVLRNELSKAEGTYKLLLKEHPHSRFTVKASQRLYDIADYWLNDTRKQMELYEQKRSGKVWFVPPSFVHWSKDKPFLDEEGRALLCLEAVAEADINGPLREKALFYLGTVHYFRENFREADHFYSQIYDPKSAYSKGKWAPKAIKQSILCKQFVNGGSKYDRRTLEQARKLVHDAEIMYPELAQNEKDWLERQKVNINHMQAEGDFNQAEFYLRVGKPGAAYFYYELVRRRYPGTDFGEKSIARMNEIRSKAETEQRTLAKADDDLRKVQETVTKYDMLALPVVDEQGILLGIITVDDVMETVIPDRGGLESFTDFMTGGKFGRRWRP